jgi:hypothetical protein
VFWGVKNGFWGIRNRFEELETGFEAGHGLRGLRRVMAGGV